MEIFRFLRKLKMTKSARHFQMDFSFVSLTQNDKGVPSLQVDFLLRLAPCKPLGCFALTHFALHPLQNLTQLCGYKAF